MHLDTSCRCHLKLALVLGDGASRVMASLLNYSTVYGSFAVFGEVTGTLREELNFTFGRLKIETKAQSVSVVVRLLLLYFMIFTFICLLLNRSLQGLVQ